MALAKFHCETRQRQRFINNIFAGPSVVINVVDLCSVTLTLSRVELVLIGLNRTEQYPNCPDLGDLEDIHAGAIKSDVLVPLRNLLVCAKDNLADNITNC